jgi:hypothetical protein
MEEMQEVRNMSRKLRQLKRQMFLKQVEATSSVDSFRSLIMGLTVEQDEAKQAVRWRSNSLSSERTLSRFSSFNGSCSSMGDRQQIEE